MAVGTQAAPMNDDVADADRDLPSEVPGSVLHDPVFNPDRRAHVHYLPAA